MISNRLLFKEVFKNNIWAMVLSLILFFIFMFLPVFMIFSNYLEIWNEGRSMYVAKIIVYSCHGAVWQIVPLIFMAIVMGIKTFAYLHNKKQIDFYHSLPVKRSKIFFLNYSMGILTVIPIYIISALLLTTLIYSLGFGEYINILLVFKNIIWNIVFFIAIYSIFNLAAILTGNTIISVLLGWFLLNITGLIYLLKMFMTETVWFNMIGYYSEVDIIKNFINVPVVAMSYMSINNFKPNNFYTDCSLYGSIFNYTGIILKYVVFIIVILAINYWLFIKRKSEKAGDCIAFDKIKGVLKYVGIIIGSMYVNVIFQVIGGTVWSFIGVLIACTLFHFVVEIIYEFDFKAIFKNWYSIFGCILISVGILLFLRSNILNNDEIVIPNVEKVAQVDIYNYSFINTGEPLESPEVIENVMKLLSYSKEYYENGIYDDYSSFYYAYIGYKFKNGKIVYNRVQFPLTDTSKEILYDIINSEEYILKRDPVLNVVTTEKTEVMLFEELFGKHTVYNEYGDGEEFLLTLQNDIKNNIGKDKGEIIYILYLNIYDDISWHTHISYYPIYESYEETIKLIEERLNVKQLSADDIQSIDIDGYSTDYYGAYSATNLEEIEYILENIKPKELFENDDVHIFIRFRNSDVGTDYVLTKDVDEVIENLKVIVENNEDSESGIIEDEDVIMDIAP